jgi:hypothetical protein
VLNSIPDPVCILTASTIAIVSICMIALAVIKWAKWIKKGKVVKMGRKVAGPWWASAFVVGLCYRTSAAESG